jgi:hypothetical protein
MREKADVIHEMGRGEALVGTLRVTSFAGATRYPDITHEMDRRTALVGTLSMTRLVGTTYNTHCHPRNGPEYALVGHSA